MNTAVIRLLSTWRKSSSGISISFGISQRKARGHLGVVPGVVTDKVVAQRVIAHRSIRYLQIFKRPVGNLG